MADLREACAQRFTQEEMELLDRAIAFAKEAHKDQKRESGEPYTHIRKRWRGCFLTWAWTAIR